MFGTPARIRRPVLLILVYGVFLVIVGVTAAAQAVMVSAHFSTTTLNSTVQTDAALVRAFVRTYLAPADFDGSVDAVRQSALERQLGSLVKTGEILRVEVRRPDGVVLASDVAGLSGSPSVRSAEFASATEGNSAIVGIVDVAAGGAVGPALATPTVVREFFPLSVDDRVRGVVAIWRDAVPILSRLEDVRRSVVLATLSAALVAAFVLYLVFRSAQGRITR
ncbi:MAG: hypothetical protein ACJ761_10945, partial [Chloroflexota bacterium]